MRKDSLYQGVFFIDKHTVKGFVTGVAVTLVFGFVGVNAAGTFTDVPSGQWYSTAVDWAKSNGVMNGTSPTTFDPGGPVSRAQLAEVLYNLSKQGLIGNQSQTTPVPQPVQQPTQTSTTGSVVGNYTFSNYSMSSDAYSTTVLGEIANTSSTTHNVNFTVNFYDASGKLLGTANGSVLDLAPGQKKSFEAISDSPIQGVSVYSFQIDGEW